MDSVNNEMARLLEKSCKHFARHALEHALLKQKSETDITQAIFNIQAALEVIAKLYQLKNEGWKSIVDKKHHNDTEIELLKKLKNGELKTHAYWNSKDYIESKMLSLRYEKELLARFQNYRNSVAHLGLPNLPDDVESDILILLIRVINTLNWDESMPAGEKFIENHASKFLGGELFLQIMNHPTYISEAIDQAYDHCETVHKCLECGNESWGETDLDVVLCFSCGYKVPDNIISFVNCPNCFGKKSVVYSTIEGHGIKVPGKCTDCGLISELVYCRNCGEATPYKSEWTCTNCE